MKRNTTLILLLLVNVIIAHAAVISENEALRKAAEFVVNGKGNLARSMVKGADMISSVSESLKVAESCDAYYAFNLPDNGGFVIVSGDDRMPDVLGYSDSGSYDAENMPENMKAWMDGYAEQFEYLQSHSNVRGASLTAVTGERIFPMLQSVWGQKSPYNKKCPSVGNVLTPTGCVATAMAQVMYYHKWPQMTNEVIPAYTTAYMHISVPETPITSIDWERIMPECLETAPEEQQDAIATLMMLCGRSVKMDYRVDASGSSLQYALTAFPQYFDYKSETISYVSAKSYSADEWNQMIYDELKNGRPVLYEGSQTPEIGHAFVIDGYGEDNFFHVNWGWYGSYDGYFRLNALDTENGSFNTNQGALIGVEGKGEKGDGKFAYAVLENNVLTFYYDDKRAEKTGVICSLNKIAEESQTWGDQEEDEKIKKVVFDSSFADYHQLTSTASWFYRCTSLTDIEGLENLNTENVSDMSGMFANCTSLKELDLSSLNTGNVRNMEAMFGGTFSMKKLNVSQFNTANVTNMSQMFYNCGAYGADFTLDLTSFTTDKVTDTEQMFAYCYYLEAIYVSSDWNLEKVENGEDMFLGCYGLSGGNGTEYDDENVDYTYARIDKGQDSPGYFTQKVTPVPYAVLSNENKTLTFYYGTQKAERGGMRVTAFSSSKEREWDSVASLIENVVFDASFAECLDIFSTSYWFYGCSNLTELPDFTNLDIEKITEMNYMFAGCSSLTTVTLPEGMTFIGRSAFSGCSSLDSLSVPNSVVSIGHDAFYGTAWYDNQPEGLVYAGKVVYKYKGMLTETSSVTIDEETLGIAEDAFYECQGLATVIIPNSVVSIGEDAFYGCLDLTEVYCYAENVPVTNPNAFDNTNIAYATLYVPEESISAYGDTEPWSKFGTINNIIPQCATPTIDFVDGKLTFACETEEVKYVYNIALPEEVEIESSNTDLPTIYIVSAYAKKEGYKNSEIVLKEITIGGSGGIRGDANLDGRISMQDAMFIINYILNGKFPDEE